MTSRGPRTVGKPADQLEASFISPPRFFSADPKEMKDDKAMPGESRTKRRVEQMWVSTPASTQVRSYTRCKT